MTKSGKPLAALDLATCLGYIFGENGESLTGLSVAEALAQMHAFVYPVPTVSELDAFLGTLPGIVATDSRNRELGILSNFRVDDGRVTCDIDRSGRKPIEPKLVDAFIAVAMKTALEDFLAAVEPGAVRAEDPSEAC